MSEPDPIELPTHSESETDPDAAIQPSWKPLLWLGGSLAALIGLWEIFLELGLHLFDLLFEILESIWLILIEAPEEYLEDLLADWLKHHFPHEADRYSEITTAIGLTPLKLLLIVMLARWIWQHSRTAWWPRIQRWFHVRVTEVRLAWEALWWPYRLLGGLLFLVVILLPFGI